MAGEFFVRERLFRLGHEPALTLGNAKTIDIIVRTQAGKLKTISVKAIQAGGKWGVGKDDLSQRSDLVFVFLLYKSFKNVTTDPQVWVMNAADVQKRKSPWIGGQHAICHSHHEVSPRDLDDFEDAWDRINA